MQNNSSVWNNDYFVGLEISWIFSYNKDDLKSFSSLTKDFSLLHSDTNFSKDKGYNGPIIHGMLLSSQISRLIGQELPDKNGVLTGMKIDFLNPAYPDSNLEFFSKLHTKSESSKALLFKFLIKEKNEILSKGEVMAIWRPKT